MNSADALAAFLAERLDEDEARAKDELESLAWMIDNNVQPAATVRSRAEDAVPRLGRALREVRAKREILRRCKLFMNEPDDYPNGLVSARALQSRLVLMALAAVYEDYPGYEELTG